MSASLARLLHATETLHPRSGAELAARPMLRCSPMTSHEPTNPRVVLSEDHRRIDGLLDRLLGGVRADDREVTAKVLSKLERTLLNHINVEEMFVFPALAETHASEAERLGREHAKIRQALGELGLALELHVLRAEAVQRILHRAAGALRARGVARL